MKPFIGEVFETNNCGKCTVIDYIDKNNVKVRFENGYVTFCAAGNLRKGNVRNPFIPVLFNVGFSGEGSFSYTSHKKIFRAWGDMLTRCYSETFHSKQPTYLGCTVDERWHNFQNFAADYLQMTGSDLDWQLDKDLLVRKNKIYSNETCCLLPHALNMAIQYESRNEFEPGVYTVRDKFTANIQINGKNKNLGTFLLEHEAGLKYKSVKEDYVKELSNKFKDLLDPKVYNALINWEVVLTG